MVLNYLLLKARQPIGIAMMTLFNLLFVAAVVFKAKTKFPGPTPIWLYVLVPLVLVPGFGRLFWYLRYRRSRKQDIN